MQQANYHLLALTFQVQMLRIELTCQPNGQVTFQTDIKISSLFATDKVWHFARLCISEEYGRANGPFFFPHDSIDSGAPLGEFEDNSAAF
jgi:hypothetical protein